MAQREIEQAMFDWIDERVELKMGPFLHPVNLDPIVAGRQHFIRAVEACVGIREAKINNTGPLVELIQKTVGGADKEPWCMSFMQTCIAYAEVKTGTKSKFPVTEHCLTAWNSAPPELKVKYFPAKGAICIWRHGDTTSGHTGMVLVPNQESFTAIEGNTESGMAPNGKVERDGGGVYRTTRKMDGTGSMRVVGFLKPF